MGSGAALCQSHTGLSRPAAAGPAEAAVGAGRLLCLLPAPDLEVQPVCRQPCLSVRSCLYVQVCPCLSVCPLPRCVETHFSPGHLDMRYQPDVLRLFPFPGRPPVQGRLHTAAGPSACPLLDHGPALFRADRTTPGGPPLPRRSENRRGQSDVRKPASACRESGCGRRA